MGGGCVPRALGGRGRGDGGGRQWSNFWWWTGLTTSIRRYTLGVDLPCAASLMRTIGRGTRRRAASRPPELPSSFLVGARPRVQGRPMPGKGSGGWGRRVFSV